MRQLPLFSADHEAARRLHEAYAVLSGEAKDLAAEVEVLRTRLAQAKVECRTLTQERDQAQRERDQAHLDVRHWHSLYTIALMLRRQGPTLPPATLEPTLKRLLTLAHPDGYPLKAGQFMASMT